MKLAVTFLCALLPAMPSAVAAADPWDAVRFLTGSWRGDGKAESATGSGTTVFTWEVSNQVLVRRDRTEYAATSQHPAYTYEALMVIYEDAASNGIEASYFDSGNHVLHYKLALHPQPGFVQFLSDSPGPVFRLSYKLTNPRDLQVTFEMQPPGAGTFRQVAAGVVHRQ